MTAVASNLMTAEEFAEFVARPENLGRVFELDRGEVIEMPRPGKKHGLVCANVSGILRNYAIARKKGYVCSNDTGVLVERDPDTVRGPDVAFYEDNQTPGTMERRYSEKLPTLIVEVLSPSDHPGKLLQRIKQYLSPGNRLVWVVDPEYRFVSAYRPGREYQILSESDEITGEDVLPDFRCRVAEFFAMPGG